MADQNPDIVTLYDAMLELENGEGDGDSSKESGIDEAQNELGSPGAGGYAEVGKNQDVLEGGNGTECVNPYSGFTSSEKPMNKLSNTEGDDSRKDVKKQTRYDSALSQQRRRKETLKSQKNRRDEILEKIRQLEDSAYSDSETEDEMDFVASVGGASGTLAGITEERPGIAATESMEVSSSRSSKKRSKAKNKREWRPRYKQAPCGPMLSEWMLEVPEDFGDNKWLGVVCPVGKRCIVLASRGKTKIFSRVDQYLGSYRSLLPGGCKYNYSAASTNRNRGVTILDCIWSPESLTFYVLDMICWNSHSCVNCDTEYRQFFLRSKFSENMELQERSQSNPFPFIPLMFFEAGETSTVLSSPFNFSEEIDGLLYFHKEAFYSSETNPLCLWILLTQVESILNIYVAPEVLSRQTKPKNLGTRSWQIRKKEKQKIKQSNQNMEVH